MTDQWEYPDIESYLASRDIGDAVPIASERVFPIAPMGFQPEGGAYIIDPDYFEFLGFNDFSELIRYRR